MDRECAASSSNAEEAVDDTVIAGEDELIGSDSDFDEDSGLDDQTDDRTTTAPLPTAAMVRLRQGATKVSAEKIAEAAQHLAALPYDYEWKIGIPQDKCKPPWNPVAENDPINRPDFTGKSLFTIFVQMADRCLRHMVKCTNAYGISQYPKAWPMLQIPQIMLFVAILFHMDVEQRSSLVAYWSRRSRDAFIESTGISRTKFLMWYQHIRLYQREEVTAAEIRENKIYKVEKYLNLAQLSMQSMRFTVCQKLSLDEEMTTFKGRCGLIQLIKNKPRGEGLKYYALCDPKSGYVYATLLHSGTYVPFQEIWGRIVAICFKLLNGDRAIGLRCFLDQGYFVYTDRYYTTVQMNYSMSLRRTYFCGTLRREQRANLPLEIMWGTRRGCPTPSVVKSMKRGDVLRRFSNYGDTCALSWMDATLVTFLTSIDDSFDEPLMVYRKSKDKSGRMVKEIVCQPSTAKDFSENMGGVDIHDQNTTTVKKHRRSRRWYVSGVFLQSLDWFAHNSFILWKDFNPNSKLSNKEVKGLLANELKDAALKMLGKGKMHTHYRRDEDYNPSMTPPISRNRQEVRSLRLNNKGDHFPRKFLGKGRECMGHKQRVTTNMFCNVCGVFLCSNGCFGRFHERLEYLYDDPKMTDRQIVRSFEKF